MTGAGSDPIARFYDRHPYPPPVDDLTAAARGWEDGTRRRIEHHRRWPALPFRDGHSILVAGCGTSQAARYAIRHPNARVVGIDVSPTSISHTRALAEQHDLEHLEVRELPIEHVGDLGEAFDQVVCTGVIHHLDDPPTALHALRDVLSSQGTIDLMVYAPYGRAGIEMIQAYCRMLAVRPEPDDINDLIATLREVPAHHPIAHLLRETPDFADDDALADALLNPREQSYSVPEVFELLDAAGLRFTRWLRQAPYLPGCGSVATVPHGRQIAALDAPDQYAAVELFRGTIMRHSLLARRDDAPPSAMTIEWVGDRIAGAVPIRETTAVSVTDRLPPGVAAALLNRAHVHPDLVMFVDDAGLGTWNAIDGRHTIDDLGGDIEFFKKLWDHDLVVLDTSGTIDGRSRAFQRGDAVRSHAEPTHYSPRP